MLWQPALAAFVVTLLCLRVLVSHFGRQLVLDRPNERSLHEHPVPRTGGIAILCGAAVALEFGAAELWLPVILAVVLAALSFADDVYGVPTE